MSEVANIPQLRFPGFGTSKECETYTKHIFQDIFDFSTGKNIKQSEASPEFETPCVRYGELYHMYSEVISNVINKTNLDKSELSFSKGNEILLPSAGEDPLDIGSASALTIANVAIGRTINILRPLSVNTYSQRYVAYYINHKLRKKIATLAKGVSISNVYNSDLRRLSINLPCLSEQQKIAAFLTAVDNKIELLGKKQALLKEYKKGLMQQIFSQEIRFSPKGTSSQAQGEIDDGSEFADWEEKKLGDVGKVYQPKTISQTDLTTKGFDVYGANGIIGKYSEYNHEFEQIAVTCRGNTCGTVNFTKPKSWITGNAMVVNVDDSKVVNKTFIYYQLSHTNLTYLITGSGQPQITGDIKTHKVKIPSLPEQTKIANFLSSIDSKIEQVGEQLDKSKQFKKALLQQMFV